MLTPEGTMISFCLGAAKAALGFVTVKATGIAAATMEILLLNSTSERIGLIDDDTPRGTEADIRKGRASRLATGDAMQRTIGMKNITLLEKGIEHSMHDISLFLFK